MKKTTSKGPTFSMHFRTLSTAANITFETARSNISSTIDARKARLELGAAHIRQGGKISPRDMKQLSLPEQAYLKAVELGQNPDLQDALKKASKELDKTVKKGKKLFGEIFGEGTKK